MIKKKQLLSLTLEYDKTSQISFQESVNYFRRLLPTLCNIKENHKIDNSIFSFINLPNQNKLIKDLAYSLLQYKPSMLIVIGIGGSNIGAEAIIQALKYKKKYNLEFCSIDTVDGEYLKYNLDLAEKELIKGNKVILNVITKSGTTIETIANASIFIELLKKYFIDYQKYVVITTDKDSPIWYMAKDKYNVLEIPKFIGGRFSVLTSVGLFPFALLGLDVDLLLQGAMDMREYCLTENFSDNFAAISAITNYVHYKLGKNITNFFLFDPSLFMLGNWYRQLIGESLGKNQVGITPIISIGTADLHSVTQLYLDGPNDKFTTFLSIKDEGDVNYIPNNEFSQIQKNTIDKSLKFIKKSVFYGTQKAYSLKELPFISIIMPEKNEFYLGQLIMMKVFEVIYLAALLKVNPFDQPAVEIYKKETQRILSN